MTAITSPATKSDSCFVERRLVLKMLQTRWFRAALMVPRCCCQHLRHSGQKELGATRSSSRLAPDDPQGGQAVAKLAGSPGCQHQAQGLCRCVKTSCRFAGLAMAVKSVPVLPQPRAVSGLVPCQAACPVSELTLDTEEQTK